MEDLVQSVDLIDMSDDSQNSGCTRNLSSNLHPRLDYYKKCSARFIDQEERRKKILKEQKKYKLDLNLILKL